MSWRTGGDIQGIRASVDRHIGRELVTLAVGLTLAVVLAGCGALEALDEFGRRHLELWSNNLPPPQDPPPGK